MSLWVYADTIDTNWRTIAGKGHEQYYMQLKCLGENRATWEFVEFQDNRGWEYTEDSVPPAPGAGEWLYEWFPPVAKNLELITNDNGVESSDTHNMLQLTEDPFCMNQNAEYVDFFERALYNHILSTQHPERS